MITPDTHLNNRLSPFLNPKMRRFLLKIQKRVQDKPGYLKSLAALEGDFYAEKETSTGFHLHAAFKSITHHIEEIARQIPDKLCLVHGNETVTFCQLNNKANQFANYLLLTGVKRQQFVPLCLNRGIDMMIAMLGILKAGAVYVPLDPDHPKDRLAYMLNDLKATLAVCSVDTSKILLECNVPQLIQVDGEMRHTIFGQPESDPKIITHYNDLAYVIYTSGSTGLPKGVLIEHGALMNYLVNTKTRYINTDDNPAGSFIHLSNTFDASITALFMPMIAGKLTVIGSGENTKVFDDPNLWKYAPYDFVKITPAHLDFLIPTIKDNGEWITKTLVIGGEALYPGHFDYFIEKKVPLQIVNEYGPTEATVGCTTFSFNLKEIRRYKKEIPIGQPIDETGIFLLTEENGQLLPGKEGEIYIGGSGLARGYLNRNELTNEKFITNPIHNSKFERLYKTGDIGTWLPDGNLGYKGRIDDQVKIAGYRIELGEIENTVNSIDLIRGCCVLATGQGADKRLTCYFVPDESKIQKNNNDSAVNNQNRYTVNRPDDSLKLTFITADQEAYCSDLILNYLQAKLPAYMIPGHFIGLKQLPLTGNGKVDKSVLGEIKLLAKNDTSARNPTNRAEKLLLKIWQKIFYNHKVTITDDFFAIGGSSIQAAKLFNLVRKKFSVQLPITTLVNAPTIEKLAAEINNQKANEGFTPVFAFRSSGSQTPLFLLHAGAGDILFYKELAHYLGDDQPVYGVAARGLDGKRLPLTSIEEMGKYYVAEILKIQPEGPYRLAGYCLGAIICFEMTALLSRMGHEVEFLASINGISPTYKPESSPAAGQTAPADFGKGVKGKMMFHYDNLRKLSFLQICKYPFNRLHRKLTGLYIKTSYKLRLKVYNYFLSGKKNLPVFLARQFYYDTNYDMASQYLPKMYGGKMFTFRSSHIYRERTLGWKDFVTGHIESFVIPGYHENRRVILHEPHVKILADKMNDCLSAISS